ncbi:sensor histidine kinase [Halospina sp. K52047b]|uniref:ATP-binding protein n=1 Tax=Halospina sp. K52047b TaxID=2614160 RepID=UPI00124ADACE|nr:sensor histidine kinase [Halospina sp. K52047b]KAA8981961.1 sensor histidine kinase [Halospina sp. K52047b]
MPWIDLNRSIRRTLLIVLLPAAIALMGAAWIIHGALLERMARSFVEDRLREEANFLAHRINQADGRVDALSTGDYFEEVFHHAFAVRVGSRRYVSLAPWRPLLSPHLDENRTGFIRQTASSETISDYLAYRQTVDLGDREGIIVVAEELSRVNASQRELHIWTGAVSAVLLGLLVLVIWVAIRLSLASVATLKTALKELQQGTRERLDIETPEEFRPLVRQLNQLLDTLDQRLIRSREALANLSHSIKTPITAVRQVLEEREQHLDWSMRQQLARRLSELDGQLETEMRRSRFAGAQAGKGGTPVSQARELIWMLGQLYPDKDFELETVLADERQWPVEEYDLNEVLGSLLDNAGKWAKERVTLSLREDEAGLVIEVSDDGPGVSPDRVPALGQRGQRLDEQAPGHGLGLAIVQDVIRRYGGWMAFDVSEAGGLLVRVELPERISL